MYNIFAVSFNLGTILPGLGPGLSALNKYIVLEPKEGAIAKINIKNPIPPIQWAKLLQNNIPLGRDSISASIVAPVVVNPDTVSKNESTKDGIAPLITKGSAPTTDITIHDNPTVRNPSFSYISLSLTLTLRNIKARGNIKIIVTRNALASPPP